MGSRFKDCTCQLLQERDYPPQHFSVKIMPFSLIVQSSTEKYISDQFQVGDHKWKLHIHQKEGEGCISIYLELANVSSFDLGWSIKAVIKFFVMDQNTSKYYTTPGPDSVVVFHPLKKLSGIDRFIDVPTFELSSNGYLVNDQCVFGTEVFIITQAPQVEMLVLRDEDLSLTFSHIWKIKSFSSLSLNFYDSEEFICADFKWKIRLHPKGCGVGKNNNISVYLVLNGSLPNNIKVYVKHTLCLLKNDNLNMFDLTGYHYFSALSSSWGYGKFMALDELYENLVDDCCSIKAQVTVLGMVNTTT